MNEYTDKARKLRNAMGISFVTLSEKGDIDDVTVGEHDDLFSGWAENVSYTAGNIRAYDGKLYKCLQAHTSQAGWEPDVAAGLWRAISDPTAEWPEWSQPVGAGDTYSAGDKVAHNGKHWISAVDNNVWEPGIQGTEALWTEAPIS